MNSPSLPKIAVIGADGYLGSNLLKMIRIKHPEAVGTSRRNNSPHFYLDIINIPDLHFLKETEHTHAIITIADPKVSSCSSGPAESHKLNVEGPISLTKQLINLNISPIILSSDRVFDGCKWEKGSPLFSEESPVYSKSEYGKQKIIVDKWIQDNLTSYLIIRLSKVYGTIKGDGTMLDDIASRLTTGRKVDPPYDQYFNPIHINDVVNGILKLIISNAHGTYNVCAQSPCSRREMGLKMAQELKQHSRLVPLPPEGTIATPMDATKFFEKTKINPLLPMDGVRKVAQNYILKSEVDP